MKKIKIFVLFTLLFIPIAFINAGFDYVPMEKIPFFGENGGSVDFCNYIDFVYKFGIAAVSIAALIMLVIGGFMYSTSAGNNAAMENAKRVLFDALIGLLLALVGWLVLYTINPELTFCKLPRPGAGAPTVPGEIVSPVVPTMPANCNAPEWQKMFEKVSSQTGIDKCVLMATAAKESSCNQVPARTYGGRDCGVTQIAAKENCGTTCEELEANPEKALICSANYFKRCSSGWRSSPEEQKIRDMYAGYNGGCGALKPSTSCTGQKNSFGNDYQKWDCPVDPGGYAEVPARTTVFYGFYQQCKGSS